MKGTILRIIGTTFTVLCLLGACQKRSEPVEPAVQGQAFAGTIVAVGDSLTAGYGLNPEDAYPARLEKKLQQAGFNWRVINAGISGETSSGALSRTVWVLRLKPDIVILETGANDGLRGIDPQAARKNIEEMVSILKRHNVTVVLAGMRALTNMGQEYGRAFSDIYPAVARSQEVILMPFFLCGVAGDPALNLEDGIHPIPEGYRIITDNIFPYVLQAIERSAKP